MPFSEELGFIQDAYIHARIHTHIAAIKEKRHNH